MSEEPRVAAGTWEEWEQARDRLTQEIVNEARCVWRNHKPGRCPYCAKNVAAARERLDTLHRAALALPDALEAMKPSAHKHLSLEESYAILVRLFGELGEAHVAISRGPSSVRGSTIAERVAGVLAAHRAALEERDALRDQIGALVGEGVACISDNGHVVALILDEWSDRKPLSPESWAKRYGGRAMRVSVHATTPEIHAVAALRSTVPAEPLLTSASSPSGSDARAGSSEQGADSGRSTSTAERV